MKQIQITQISNGWLVADAGEQPSQQNKQGVMPTVQYCEDYEAVCNTIKRYFPISS